MSIKFYVLCSSNLKATKRHEQTIPKEDIHFVFNSQDQNYIDSAVAYATSENIAYSITTSDGTPATGKNSVLDIFTASDNEYMVLVDGDDFITPHGVWTYKQLAQSSTCPDVVALEYQYGIYADWGYMNPHHYNPRVGATDPFDHQQIHGFPCRCFILKQDFWQKAINGNYIPTPEGNDFAVQLSQAHTKWAQYAYRYINNWESHCRVVFYSKAAAAHRFDTAHTIGEDTLQYFILKHEHVQGNLTMKILTDRYPTYVYDTRVEGVCADAHNRVGNRGWETWLRLLGNKYEEYDNQGKMHDYELPKVEVQWNTRDDLDSYDIVWPEGYAPDVMNLVNFPGPRYIWWDAQAGIPGQGELFRVGPEGGWE